jgi:hypothetical protein
MFDQLRCGGTPMTVAEWSRSTVDYGRKLMESTVSGVRVAEDQFREGGHLAPYFERCARRSTTPATLGVVLGACAGYYSGRSRRVARIVAGGILGGLAGFGIGMLWETRQLSQTVGSSVKKNVRQVRDEHWLEQNPIDYA